MWDSGRDEVIGKTNGPMPEVTGIKVRDVMTDDVAELALSGVFVAIGHTPNTGLFKGQLDMDTEGYLITNADSTGTKIPGIFAAGDVQDNKFRQAVTAAGTGCMAALEAEKYLAAKEAGALEAAQ